MTEETIYRHLRDFADHFEPPAPFSPHVEISNGQLVIMMSPSGAHDLNAGRITKQLAAQIEDGLFVYTADIEHPLAAKMRRPDVVVLEEAAMQTTGAVDAEAVALVVEVVSPSNPENDYVDKLRDYPVMGIPHYLIVDPRESTCVHYWDPQAGAYNNTVHYVFGDTIPLGKWSLDTTALTPYSQAAGS
ncbi:Uma2 family endonuclease [Streptomyces sp. NBC_00237]|uniref:Uma2 family endonuclease n=1 Tax=Streptomyces sp. NBC_00237 TaxID=2975687 RepID=UPI00225BBFC6|nr:Uma2 family endonuclease [Streptomyces sp. NBC_00237]MCX5204989.1 Uma2 family endonuclease [Streptomyces sp. NBC_00237]